MKNFVFCAVKERVTESCFCWKIATISLSYTSLSYTFSFSLDFFIISLLSFTVLLFFTIFKFVLQVNLIFMRVGTGVGKEVVSSLCVSTLSFSYHNFYYNNFFCQTVIKLCSVLYIYFEHSHTKLQDIYSFQSHNDYHEFRLPSFKPKPLSINTFFIT